MPYTSTTAGVQLGIFDYNGCTCQHWFLTASSVTATAPANALTGVGIYPIPALRGNFTLDLSGRKSTEAVPVEVFDLQGRSVYRQVIEHPQARHAVEPALWPGLFLVQVRQGNGLLTQKLTVL